MSNELKNCPFCGGKTYNGMGYEYGKVSCDNSQCKISGVYFYPNQWNTRADSAMLDVFAVMKQMEEAGRAVLSHDERGQGVGYAEAMNKLKAALAAAAPLKKLWEVAHG